MIYKNTVGLLILLLALGCKGTLRLSSKNTMASQQRMRSHNVDTQIHVSNQLLTEQTVETGVIETTIWPLDNSNKFADSGYHLLAGNVYVRHHYRKATQRKDSTGAHFAQMKATSNDLLHDVQYEVKQRTQTASGKKPWIFLGIISFLLLLFAWLWRRFKW